MSEEKPTFVGPPGNPNWPKACQLFEIGDYESLAKLLYATQRESERQGQAAQANILAAAGRICLVCGHCQNELAWLQQAQAEAQRREDELKQELYGILMLLDKGMTLRGGWPLAGLEHKSPSEPGRTSVLRLLWQRWQEMLQWGRERLGRQLLLPPAEVRTATPAAVELAQTHPPGLKPGGDDPALVIYCLGSFRVYQNEQLIEKWPGHKGKSIFKYMLLHRERPIHQEILMELFWPEFEPEAARRNLYQAIYHLRQALQNGGSARSYILCEENCYSLNPEVEVWLDSEAFTQHYQAGQRLEQTGQPLKAIEVYELAENLYEGDFLAEDLYEEWLLVQRENLKQLHLELLDRLSRHYFEQGQVVMCIKLCQKLLTADNCREDGHRRLMRCYLRQGQRHLALRQYHQCVEVLRQELDVPPMPVTVELYRQIQENRI